MVAELYTVYIDKKPRALMLADTEENAKTMFRQGMLGQKLGGELTAKRSADTPFEEFVRLSMEGLYMQIFQARVGAMATQGGRH